ncbi:hypothetical protein [Enterocloster lavalensis]|uniref:Uncharacterized protein n=1 Tax=Enterocloster lavalensis TaxID=460384 RepID=A0A1I0KFW6_9FIRM|nr:hypothetical protein [Enterocloster lavalensis]PST30576.1 hypothetical protein C7256_25235 [Enterocloster lavalensis]SEU23350.1 hypothetical protein SAMN05216313_1832 [Enterocloster lavalensis]
MDNEAVAAVLKDVQQFWLKWRDRVPKRESEQWDVLIGEANVIKERYGTHLVRKWEGPIPTMEEEPVAAPIVNWFVDELEARERAAYGKREIHG